MTTQEAIELLDNLIGMIEDNHNNDYDKAFRMAIEALEKQIPKNWIAEDIGEGDCAWTCPSCNSVFVLMYGTPQDNEYNYCPNCGQAMAERKGSVV